LRCYQTPCRGNNASVLPISQYLLLRSLFLCLQTGKAKGFTHTTFHSLPYSKLANWAPTSGHRRPGQEAHPWLDVIVNFEHNVVRIGQDASGSGYLVFCLLVLESDLASVCLVSKKVQSCRYIRWKRMRVLYIPAWIDALPLATPQQLLHCHRSKVLQMICRWTCDNRIPDHRLVHQLSFAVRRCRIRPCS
jgi:hypothetical protein